jgi:type VI protein secretion system component Hcp
VQDGYENQIEVISYDLSTYRPSSGGSSTAESSAIRFLIQGDVKAIPLLFLHTNDVVVFEEMTFTGVAVSNGPGTYAFLEVELEQCVITSMTQEGSTGDAPIFSIEVDFAEITIKTTALKADGTTESFGPEGWNYVENTGIETD